MGKSGNKEPIYQITCTESQLLLIGRAMERFIRLDMGQFTDFVDDIAFDGFNYQNHTDAEFDEIIHRRDDAFAQFKEAYRTLTAWPKLRGKSVADQRLIDMWETIRYQLWLDKPEPKSHTTVDSRPPLGLSGDKPIKVRRVDRR